MGGFGDQVRFKTALETILFEKSECSRKALKTNEKNKIFESKRRPKTTQDRPKMASRRSFFGSFVASFFASNFGRFLVRFWCHVEEFGEPELGFSRSIFGRFLHVVPRPPQERPRAPQDLPRVSQEVPKRLQEAPMSAPGAPKRHPRAPKRPPREP